MNEDLAEMSPDRPYYGSVALLRDKNKHRMTTLQKLDKRKNQTPPHHLAGLLNPAPR